MDDVYISLYEYIKLKKVPDYLVIQSNADLPADEMESIGFVRKEESWVISKEDAAKAIIRKLKIGPFLTPSHFERERELRKESLILVS